MAFFACLQQFCCALLVTRMLYGRTFKWLIDTHFEFFHLEFGQTWRWSLRRSWDAWRLAFGFERPSVCSVIAASPRKRLMKIYANLPPAKPNPYFFFKHHLVHDALEAKEFVRERGRKGEREQWANMNNIIAWDWPKQLGQKAKPRFSWECWTLLALKASNATAWSSPTQMLFTIHHGGTYVYSSLRCDLQVFWYCMSIYKYMYIMYFDAIGWCGFATKAALHQSQQWDLAKPLQSAFLPYGAEGARERSCCLLLHLSAIHRKCPQKFLAVFCFWCSLFRWLFQLVRRNSISYHWIIGPSNQQRCSGMVRSTKPKASRWAST